ncbi:hypothetical protein Syn6312_1710 [Synechococcus sp. PCC 6312]|nr:hypothetical protein Syn6312_1710 [Synechococcus sp. PCC 6312]
MDGFYNSSWVGLHKETMHDIDCFNLFNFVKLLIVLGLTLC